MTGEAQGMNLKEIADLLLEPVARVKRALKDGPELRPLGRERTTIMEQRYELRSVLRFVAYYRRWEARLRREKKDREKKAKAARARTTSDPRVLLNRARSLLKEANADLIEVSNLLRYNGVPPRVEERAGTGEP